jgi:acyl-CoA thioester hydrolase
MHKIPIQIRFSDIDRLGHVNNSIYNQYLDVARLDYMNQTIGKLTNWDDKTIVLVHVACDFAQPTHMTDKIFVTTRIAKIGNRSVTMHQEIIDDKGNVKVKSLSILSTLDVKNNASFPIPEEWIKAIEEFENS